MHHDLYRAVLAMDAYNREQDGLAITGNVGRAVPGRHDREGGFFVQAYTLGNDKIISYRGTDTLDSADVPSWLTALGDYNSFHAREAARFYIAEAGGPHPNGNVLLTGHSLGGGLAGFIGAIYGTRAVVFDNIAFEFAAGRLYDNARTREQYDWLGHPLGPGVSDEAARQFFYADGEPQAPLIPGQMYGYSVLGEVAANLRATQTTPMTGLHPGNVAFSGLGPIDLHSQDLLVIRAKILDRTIVWQDVPGQAKLKGHLEPMLVTFSDVTDQDSVKVIQPDQFSSRFGSDVEFIGAWVEFTKDPVSVGIEDKLPLMRKNFDDSGIRKSGTFKLYKSMLKRTS